MILRLLVPLVLLLATACASSSTPPRQEGRARYLLGVSALSEGNPTMALQELLDAEKLLPGDVEVQAALAQAYLQKRAYPLAEQHLLRAIALSGGAPQHVNNLGALYLTMERYADAVGAFRRAADNLLFATPEIAWTGMGVAQYHLADYAAAERSYKAALDLNPRFPQALMRLGELYYHRDQDAPAREALSRALALNPRLVDAHYYLGLLAVRSRDYPLARSSFNEVIRLAPDSEPARRAGGVLTTLP